MSHIHIYVRACLAALVFVPGVCLADRAAEIDRDFGLNPTPVEIRHLPEEGIETVVNHDNEPISVALSPGVERRLVFSQPVMVGVPNALAEVLQVQNVDRTVFVTATAPIPHARVLVQHTDNSRTYVLNVTTEGVRGRHTALRIEADRALQTKSVPTATIVPRLNQRDRAANSPYARYVRLTRFAAQQVYGPPRLVDEHDGGIGVVKKLDTTTEVSIVRGDRVRATPIAAWTDGVYSVTALKLQNRSDEQVVLDPRALRGRWLAATFQRNVLGVQGAANDVTALYVVSTDAFSEALGVVR